MDKSKAAADAVKLINQAKEDSNLQPLMIKAVCSPLIPQHYSLTLFISA